MVGYLQPYAIEIITFNLFLFHISQVPQRGFVPFHIRVRGFFNLEPCLLVVICRFKAS